MYGITLTVPAPIRVYDALHAELARTVTGPIEGLIAHYARPAGDGFEVTEIWESQERYAYYQREVVAPMAARLMPGVADPTSVAGTTQEFEVRGLVIPGAGIFR